MGKTIIYEKSENDILSNAIAEYIQKKISAANDIKVYEITDKLIKPCVGCLQCWYNTPGKCQVKDLSSELNQSFIYDDVVVIITKISFGGYSSAMKSVIDRGIAMVLPFLKNTEGENHHARRYKQKAKQIVIAYGFDMTNEDKEIFKKIIKANSLNYDIDMADLYFASSEKEFDNIMKKIEKVF